MKLKSLLLISLLLPAMAWSQNWNDKKYLAGAVPVNQQGIVDFQKTYEVPGKSKQEIFQALETYLQNDIIKGENARPQCRIVENSPEEGLLAAKVEEYLYFKRNALVSHGTRLFYELIFNVEDERFSVEMRRIYYIYEEQETELGEGETRRAEDWITDKEALNSKGKLIRRARNFRVFTIDRKDAIFRAAAKATGAKIKTKLVEVDD